MGEFLLYTIFFLAALLLTLIVLVQEGKGGGLTDAFGSSGQETFGVRAGGINRFTFGVFAVFVLSAMLIHWTGGDQDKANSVMSGTQEAEQPGEGTLAPPLPGENE
ncbi:MAG: preprotein translocase subunit SecG [Planctomycetota bacterium]|nr:MAG: preprotein translocase subunit SecG [Planctomycetota bacterium]